MIVLWWALLVINTLVLLYFILLNTGYLLLTIAAFRALRRYASRLKALDLEPLMHAPAAPGITLLAPAYNEEATCVEAVRALVTLEYTDYEVLVVNDGSKDATMARLTEAYDLQPAVRLPTSVLDTKPVRGVYRSTRHPNLWVIDKVNGGKADALNVGLTFARTPLVCAMDADSLLERDALARIVRPFVEDDRTVAAGGVIRIVNDCVVEDGRVTQVRLPRALLPRLQVLEYLRAFLAGRMGFDAIQATLIISGAFGVFRRETVVLAGGYRHDTVGEDMELVVRLHRLLREAGDPYRVAFIPDPVAWTECPVTLRVLGRQRDRWQRGLVETLTRHGRMLGRPAYGRIGLVAFPYFYFLEMRGPVIELLGYLAFAVTMLLGWGTSVYAVAFLALAVVLGMTLSVAALALEELTFRRYPRWQDLVGLFLLTFLENFGYRQLSTVWRVRGTWRAWRGATGWGDMERRGFATPSAPPAG